MTKKAQMISNMAEYLALNVRAYEQVKEECNIAYYGALGTGQQQSKTGLKRQIQNIRAELLELEKMLG